jgi:di/tricarboxylate transporter
VLSLFSGLMLLMAALLLGRLLTLGEMRRRFPFDLVLVIGSALTIAQVLESSGAAAIVAGAVRSVFDGHGAWGTLIGVYLLTVLLTELVTNNAAAALAFPIAISTARALDVDPMPFVMVVLYGASACFIVPFGYQTHLMVYSPGRYRMLDFVRAGLPVSIAYVASASPSTSKSAFETVIASFGAPAAGGVFVPLNPLLKPEQVGFILP